LTDTFILAAIGAPFGLKGAVRVKSLSGETAHIKQLDNVTLRINNDEKTFKIENCAVSDDPGTLLIKFSGIDSPEEAKKLGGSFIVAPRSQAAPLEKDEFYIEDLKGLRVLCANTEIGSITDILEGGGGDLAEIKLVSGEKRLVPFRKEFFGDISIAGGFIVLLEGWILEQ